MERTDDFEAMIQELEAKYESKKRKRGESEEIDPEEDIFLRNPHPTSHEMNRELTRMDDLLKNKVVEYGGMDWIFGFLEEDSSIEWFEIGQIENMWKHSYYYVPQELNSMQQPAKYVNSRRDIVKERIETVPTVEWLQDGPIERMEVVNGRHRLANWRDMGIYLVPVNIIRK